MKTTIQFHRGPRALAAGSAALILALASADIASAQLRNTTNGPNAAVTNGTSAGASMTTGDDNSAYGFSALQFTKTGIRNTAAGSFALKKNAAGSYNTALGYGALTVSTASENTALGYAALYSNTSGTQNTASGQSALFSNTTAGQNVAIGASALFTQSFNNGGAAWESNNVAVGFEALSFNQPTSATTGIDNTALGSQALRANTTGYGNTASGFEALTSSTTGDRNTADGYMVLAANTLGIGNTGSGAFALQSNTSGIGNTAMGESAAHANTGGGGNTAIGQGTLAANKTGNYNIALGAGAGLFTTGDSNIVIANDGALGESDTIRIGTKGLHTAAYIAGISGATASSGVAVYVNSDGQLGTLTSSRRFKQEIASMGGASDALLSLRPVTFRYKTEIDPQGIPQFGLIAEEVEKVAPELVARDDKGEIYTVRYEAVNAMLLNEFLKEHRRVEAQAKMIAEQARVIAEHENRFAGQEQLIAEQQKQIRTLLSNLAGVTERIERMAQRMEETKAPAVQKVLHQAPASY